MKVTANRPMVINGVSHQPGDLVDTTYIPDHKISQLLNQRRLRPAVDGDKPPQPRQPEPDAEATNTPATSDSGNNPE